MKMLVGYDGFGAAEKALELARHHANAFNAEIYLYRSQKKVKS